MGFLTPALQLTPTLRGLIDCAGVNRSVSQLQIIDAEETGKLTLSPCLKAGISRIMMAWNHLSTM